MSEFVEVRDIEPDRERRGSGGIESGQFGHVRASCVGAHVVDCVIEVGVDEEGDDVSGEGEVIFGEGWESVFDGFEETRDVGE